MFIEFLSRAFEQGIPEDFIRIIIFTRSDFPDLRKMSDVINFGVLAYACCNKLRLIKSTQSIVIFLKLLLSNVKRRILLK